MRSPAETELYYLESRYYKPAWGRFINADSPVVPTISPDSATWDKNLFAYCDNNPVNRKDDGGQFWNTFVGAVVGATSSIISSLASGNGINWTDVIVDTVAGAVAGFGVDLAIATAGVAAPVAIAAAFGFISGAGSSAYKQNSSGGKIDLKQVVIDGAIGAASNVLALGLSLPKNRSTSGKLLGRLKDNSKTIIEDGAKKVSQHGAKELVKKGNYNSIVASNIGYSVGSSSVLAASNMFWSKKVVPWLLQ